MKNKCFLSLSWKKIWNIPKDRLKVYEKHCRIYKVFRNSKNGVCPMFIGYMRVSSEGDRQTTDLQKNALLQAGVDPRHIFEDKASGAKDKKSGLEKALGFLQKRDCFLVWKLDRLRRSLSHLLGIINNIHKKGIAFRSLTEQMDTTTPHD